VPEATERCDGVAGKFSFASSLTAQLARGYTRSVRTISGLPSRAFCPMMPSRNDRSSMSYSDFNARLPEAVKKFGLTTRERSGAFADRPPATPSAHLLETLAYNVALASIATEKGRSELVVSPVLVELKRALRPDAGLFSGVDFPVDPAAGLTGTCDFLVSASSEQLFVTAPVVVVVEAKRESLQDGMGQCVAEMVAARIFNEREGNAVETVYGAVTTGTNWKFAGLTGNVLSVDLLDYLIDQPGKILGILASMVPVHGEPGAPV
jgi:hypothetical protein